MRDIIYCTFVFFLIIITDQSNYNRVISVLYDLTVLELNDRALVYTMNKNADKTHPCGPGDPVFIVMVEDILHSVRTYCCLFVRKSRTHNCNLAGMLYSASLLIRI